MRAHILKQRRREAAALQGGVAMQQAGRDSHDGGDSITIRTGVTWQLLRKLGRLLRRKA